MPETEPKPGPTRRPGPFQDAASLFNVLSNPLRLRVLALLEGGVGSLARLSEATERPPKLISAHLQALTQAGLAVSRREGKHKAYEASATGAMLVRSAAPVLGLPAARAPEAPSPVSDGPAPLGGPDELPGVLKALADPVRLRILNVLSHADEVCVCHLHEVLKLPQSTVSRHLAVLRDAGVVAGRREGTWVHYRLSHKGGSFHECLVRAIRPGMTVGSQYRLDLDRLEELPPCV